MTMYIGRNEEGLKHHFTFFLNEKNTDTFQRKGTHFWTGVQVQNSIYTWSGDRVIKITWPNARESVNQQLSVSFVPGS